MSIKERFVEYLKYKGIGQTAFEESAGLSRGAIAKKTGFSADSLEKIIAACPDLNINWLLTGIGEMLTGNNILQGTKQMPVPYEFVQAMIDERKRHDEMNAELIRQNASLIRLLEEKEKTVVQTEAVRSVVKSKAGLQE